MAIPRDRMDASRTQEGVRRTQEAQVICTCAIDDTGELSPVGCLVHPGIENARTSGRHGKAWGFSEPDASPLTAKDRSGLRWTIAGIMVFWGAFAWLVWG